MASKSYERQRSKTIKQAHLLAAMTAEERAAYWKAKADKALAKSAEWLADGNAAKERGDHLRAEICFGYSTSWLREYNRLTGNG